MEEKHRYRPRGYEKAQTGSFKLTAFPVFFLDKNRIPVRVRAIASYKNV
jgi:hypothetical protein